MPTTRRRRGHKPRQEIYAGIPEYLSTGNKVSILRPDSPVPSDDELRAAWDVLGEELTAEYIAARPGQRPWGWWRFEAPEPRWLIHGCSPLDEPGAPDWAKRLSFGRPFCFGKRQFREPPVWESQATYLDRLDLLSDEERDVLSFDYEKEEAPLGYEPLVPDE